MHMQDRVGEAELVEEGKGQSPSGPGWFILNAADARWRQSPRFGSFTNFEGAGDARFPDVGVNIHMLAPEQAACLYHRESVQEGFLVLSGECLLLVDGEERTMKQWDYFHCPAGTTHVFVGKSEPACAILMLGKRGPVDIHYPVDELAQKYNASAAKATDSPKEAYDGAWSDIEDIEAPSPFDRA